MQVEKDDLKTEMQLLVLPPDYGELHGSIDDIQTKEFSVDIERISEKLFLHHYQQKTGCSKISSSEFCSPVSYEGPNFASSCLDANNAIPTNSKCDNILKINLSAKKEQTKQRSESFRCSVCGYSATSKGNLSLHFKEVHSEGKFCDYQEGNKSNMSMHIQDNHSNEKPLKCSECEYCSGRRSDLSKHMKEVHLERKAFQVF